MDRLSQKCFHYLLFLVLTVGAGCAEEIDELIPPSMTASSTTVQFNIISPEVTPARMVMSISTPQGTLENIKVAFNNSGNNSLSEKFPLRCGEYTITNWSAFDLSGRKVAVRTQEVSFSTCEGGNIISEGLVINLTGKQVEYNKFSHLHPALSGESSGVHSLVNIDNSDFVAFGTASQSRSNNRDSFTRMTASGEVVYHQEYNTFSDPLFGGKLIRLNEHSGAVCAYTALGKNNPAASLAQFASYVTDYVIYGVDLNSGNITWTVSQDALISSVPDFMAEGSFDSKGFTATSDGGFVYLFYDKNNAGGPVMHRLIKFDDTGNVRWSREITGNTAFSRITSSNSIAGQTNGNVAILSKSPEGFPFFQLFDPSGNTLATIDHGQSGDESLRISFPYVDLSGTADGGYIITTADPVTEKLRLIKLDAMGNVSWKATYYDEPELYQFGRYSHSIQGSDGNILTAATFNEVTAAEFNTHVAFFRIDQSNGNKLLTTVVPIGGQGYTDRNLNAAISAFETNANNPEVDGIVFCGYYTPDGSDIYQKNWIAKIPADFEYGPEINHPTELFIP